MTMSINESSCSGHTSPTINGSLQKHDDSSSRAIPRPAQPHSMPRLSPQLRGPLPARLRPPHVALTTQCLPPHSPSHLFSLIRYLLDQGALIRGCEKIQVCR